MDKEAGMSWYDRDATERRAEERRRWEGDVFYDVWRGGGNPDALDYDRMNDARYNGVSAEDFASRHLGEERARRQEAQNHQAEEEYYREQERQEYYDSLRPATDEQKGTQ
jgi:hypothetical protein